MSRGFDVRPADHQFRQVGEGAYQLEIPSLGIQLAVDRLRRARHELIGELSVACELAGARRIDGGFLSIADLNLSSAQARSTRAKLLGDRSEAHDVDWFAFVEELCQRTIAMERRGTPSAPLHTFERPGADLFHDICGWSLLRDHPSILFGDGGSLKSYLALYAAALIAQRGLQVLYTDWELSGGDHRERAHRLFGAAVPVIHYLHADRPLVDEVDRVSREVRRLSIDFWIADSVGFGTAGPPEAAEHALSFCRCVRQIGIGCLLLAHTNKSDSADQKPFGSSFWHNSVRSTWFAKPATADGDKVSIALLNRKQNLGRLRPPVGFQFEFGAEHTAVRRVDVIDIPEIAEDLPVWQRMRPALSRGPKTLHELAEELDSTVGTIDRTVSRKSHLFTRVPGPDGIRRIALLSQRSA